MNATRKVKLKDITGNLTCKLCLGYLVDATTIIECLHSFCKSCILKYLEKSADLEEKYCPVCDVQLHSTKPLTSIRSDLMLQEIVYKLVPGLFKNEMSRRRKFYEETQSSAPVNQLDSGQVFDELYITSDDIIHLSMDYVTTDVKLRESARRFLKCPAAVSVFILKKFLRGKYDLPVETNIDLMFGERILPDDFLLMDIAYKYSWTMNGSKPLALSYRIKDFAKNPEIKNERTINDTPTPVESSTAISQDEATTLATNKKKVCNENGSNIMPEPEGIKIPIKLNGNIPREIIIGPIKTPNGKVRGRKRKHINYSDIVLDGTDDAKSVAKRLKSEYSPKSRPNGMVQSSTQVEANNILSNDADGNKEMKEVQLQISENGVMSARSGKERIILKVETPYLPTSLSSPKDISNPSPTTSQNLNLPEKIHFSGNFHSKTGPSGVTEIICDKPDPISASKKPSTAKPGYVTLNIPNPSNAILSQPSFRYRTIYTDADKVKESTQKQVGETSKLGTPNGKLLPKKKPTKIKLMEKIKTRIASKGKDGENVIKAISDLGRLCNSVNGLSSTSNNETGNQEAQKSPGMNSLQMSNNLLQSHNRSKPPNGTSTNCGVGNNFQLPLALNFSPSSGMSVSMIPCTATSATTSYSSISTSTTSIVPCSPSASSITPPKRLPHQTTVINGDLKFTTSPKNILPKLEESSTPKKPPKFFKSRHTTSPVSSSKQKPVQKSESESKRKTPTPNGNGLSEPSQKKVREQLKEGDQQATFNSIISQLHLAQGTTSTTSPIQNMKGMMNGGQSLKPSLTHPMVSADKYSQHLSALSNLAGNSSDSLSSKLGIALDTVCATSNGNGLPSGMVPFVTDNYCSMPLPFLNQRHPMPQLALPFGFPYNLVTANALAMNSLQSTTPKAVAASADLNLHPSKETEKPKQSASLDLTVGKSGKNSPNTAPSSQKEPPSTSLLANLLNSTSNPIHPAGESDTNNHERKRSKTPVNKISNVEHHRQDKRPSQTFSPKPKQESNTINGKSSSQSDGKDQKSDSKLSPLNGKKDAATAKNDQSHTETTNGLGKAKPQNGSTESGTRPECSTPVQSGANLSSLTNNNSPTVSNNYDKSPTQPSDSVGKVQDSLDSAKTESNEKGVSSSPTIGPKCGRA